MWSFAFVLILMCEIVIDVVDKKIPQDTKSAKTLALQIKIYEKIGHEFEDLRMRWYQLISPKSPLQDIEAVIAKMYSIGERLNNVNTSSFQELGKLLRELRRMKKEIPQNKVSFAWTTKNSSVRGVFYCFYCRVWNTNFSVVIRWIFDSEKLYSSSKRLSTSSVISWWIKNISAFSKSKTVVIIII